HTRSDRDWSSDVCSSDLAIYLMSKRLSDQVERFMKETRAMIVAINTITENLRTVSANIVEIGAAAREQFRRVEVMVTDTGDALRSEERRVGKEGRARRAS